MRTLTALQNRIQNRQLCLTVPACCHGLVRSPPATFPPHFFPMLSLPLLEGPSCGTGDFREAGRSKAERGHAARA